MLPNDPFPVVVRVPLVALVHSAEEGGYWAEVPALPGCITQGETLNDVRANLLDAAGAWILSIASKGRCPCISRHDSPQI